MRVTVRRSNGLQMNARIICSDGTNLLVSMRGVAGMVEFRFNLGDWISPAGDLISYEWCDQLPGTYLRLQALAEAASKSQMQRDAHPPAPLTSARCRAGFVKPLGRTALPPFAAEPLESPRRPTHPAERPRVEVRVAVWMAQRFRTRATQYSERAPQRSDVMDLPYHQTDARVPRAFRHHRSRIDPLPVMV
jgi:hypothetical protein